MSGLVPYWKVVFTWQGGMSGLVPYWKVVFTWQGGMPGLVPHCKAFFVLYRVGCQAWCRSTTVRATPCSASPFTACSWPQANIHRPPFWTSTLSFCRGLYFVFLCFSGSSCNSNIFSSSKYCTVHTRTSKCPQSGVVQWNRRRKKRMVIGEWDMNCHTKKL